MKNNIDKYCTIYVVRHGETEWNVKDIIMGHKDSPLTRKGKKQARNIASNLRSEKFDSIFSSDLLRAKRTAEIIALEHNLVIKTSKLLREKTWGSWEGKLVKRYRKELQSVFEKYQRLSEKKKHTFRVAKDIETNEEIAIRLITFLREAAVAYAGKNIVVVTHGVAMTILLIHLGFATYDELTPAQIDNAAYVKILSDGIDFFVKETFGVHKLQT